MDAPDSKRPTGAAADLAPALRPRSAAARRLIEATIEAIDVAGEGAVRVQEIADAAGVPIPILYRHFGNRDGLLQVAQVERLSRALDRELQELGAAMDTVVSDGQFRELFDVVLASLFSIERRSARWKRINVIGSTYGRPALAEAVAAVQSRAIHQIALVLRGAQQNGWLRPGLDLDAFAAWFAGQTLGRILIELAPSEVDEAAWNAISADAVRHVLLR